MHTSLSYPISFSPCVCVCGGCVCAGVSVSISLSPLSLSLTHVRPHTHVENTHTHTHTPLSLTQTVCGCMCGHVCMYVCMYVWVHACMCYECACVSGSKCLRNSLSACTYGCASFFLLPSVCVRPRACVHACVSLQSVHLPLTCVCMRVCVLTCVHVPFCISDVCACKCARMIQVSGYD